VKEERLLRKCSEEARSTLDPTHPHRVPRSYRNGFCTRFYGLKHDMHDTYV
jgi:hypothetical protein